MHKQIRELWALEPHAFKFQLKLMAKAQKRSMDFDYTKSHARLMAPKGFVLVGSASIGKSGEAVTMVEPYRVLIYHFEEMGSVSKTFEVMMDDLDHRIVLKPERPE